MDANGDNRNIWECLSLSTQRKENPNKAQILLDIKSLPQKEHINVEIFLLSCLLKMSCIITNTSPIIYKN